MNCSAHENFPIMILTGKSFPDGTPYIANPQKYYGDLAANSQKGYSKGLCFWILHYDTHVHVHKSKII